MRVVLKKIEDGSGREIFDVQNWEIVLSVD